ncbi:ATP-dependent helicase [Schnuerera sp. xch1]|uniref:ATP-dependent helicase n=1 Tax=Schnuerera sp. xch1 TaxID=2874283 RepID=UPI001CC073D7|nr:ATP-dependent helicase [Schnuerera sp. xch1]MBZ2174227.1 ATP-dependent helicase [Schnuerera sp. xch1]
MNLSKEQKKAIYHTNGPALILAVPGAGKTTVLIHRTANLIINYNISPEKILSITFSKSSAKDMKDRFNKLYGNISKMPVRFSTIHSFSYSLIREYAFKNKIRYILIEDQKKKLNKFNILKKIYFSTNNDYISEEKLEALINSIGYIKNMLITPREFLSKSKIEIKNFKDIFEKYESYKRDNKLIDFDDMLTLSLKILQNDMYILDKYRSKYEYIQVDEGQDTSKVQMEIIKLLSQPKNNLFIVADDDQSIYGFRGAYPMGLFEFNKIYDNSKIFYMEQNYRSTKNIVSVCNKFIKKNTLRYSKNIFTQNSFLEPINIVKVNTLEDQYEFIINGLKNSNYNNTAILYTNNISSIGIIEYLQRNNIPFYMKDTKIKFFNHWIVQDIIHFFILSQDNSNIESFKNIYFKMNGFISKKQLNYIKTLNHNQSIFNKLLDIPGITQFYRKNFLDLKLAFKKLSKMKPLDAINHIEKNLGYEDYLKESCMKFGHTFDTLRTILNYTKIIASKTKDFNDFIERLKYLQYLCTQSKGVKEGITLSTIHSAKGLEFERVYIIDLVEGDFPTISSIDAFNRGNIEALEEERRLFYVGMTRAKNHLILLTIDNKNSKKMEVSRFLKELEELEV